MIKYAKIQGGLTPPPHQDEVKVYVSHASCLAEHIRRLAISFLCHRSYGQKTLWPQVTLRSSLKPKCNM